MKSALDWLSKKGIKIPTAKAASVAPAENNEVPSVKQSETSPAEEGEKDSSKEKIDSGTPVSPTKRASRKAKNIDGLMFGMKMNKQ